MRIRRVRKGTRVRAIAVYVNGRKAKAVRGYRRSLRLTPPARRNGKARVVVVVKAVRHGRPVTLRSRHTYEVCKS